MLLNATKCHGYSFYHFWVIKGGGGTTPPLPPPRLGLIHTFAATFTVYIFLRYLCTKKYFVLRFKIFSKIHTTKTST